MEKEELEEKLEELLRENFYEEIVRLSTEKKENLVIDYEAIESFDPFLGEELINFPSKFFECGKRVLERIDLPSFKQQNIFLRIKLTSGLKKRIRDLRAKDIKKFIRIEGVVKRASEVKPEIEYVTFTCTCGNTISVIQSRKTIVWPQRCDKCGSKKFEISKKKLMDARKILLEDLFEATSGEKPGQLIVYIKDVLTPRLQRKTDPGARIAVSGILQEFHKKIDGKESRRLEIFLLANHIETLEEEFEEVKLNDSDIKEIKALAKSPKLYEKLRNSLATSIYGLEEVKMAILLLLAGGVPRTLPDGTRIRGDIHLLLVGDPSTGKTQLLKLVSRVIPRGRYVSGKGVSGAGLTATVTKDEEFGGWVLEAGSLVLCNKSALCIDEFDKISKEDIANLHEGMSTQTISISKASIHATLPGQTSIIAGANPKFQRFDIYKGIAEQIAIPETLLSRFDLKFVMQDRPDKENDEKIVDHIVRARMNAEKIKPEIEPDLIKKYIAYIRQLPVPKMREDALMKIKEFYLKLRKEYSPRDGTVSIAPRQLEALIRLSEASAKIRLSQDVEKKDAERAIWIVEKSLEQLGRDLETGKLDIDRTESRLTSSKRNKYKYALDLLEEFEKEGIKNVPINELLERLKGKVDDPEQIIRELKRNGMIFEPRHGFVQKI